MRRHFTAYILAAFTSIFLTAQTNAQIRPYVLEGTEVHSVPSKILGRDYEIFVSLPESYPIKEDAKNDPKKETTKPNAPKAYPVMFVTDANYAFPLLRSINRRVADHGENLQEFILVALSYAKGDDPAFSRDRDYTPTDIDRKKTRAIDQNGEVYGQAEKYRRYVAEEVFPYVAQHFRADMKRKVFAGHSYGALFGAHVLLTSPAMFNNYILSSASLWFDNGVIFDTERRYAAANVDLPAKVLLLNGAYETVRPNTKNRRFNKNRDLITDMRRFERQLKSHRYPSLSVQSEVIADEDHLTVAPAALTRGLLWAFGKP